MKKNLWKIEIFWSKTRENLLLLFKVVSSESEYVGWQVVRSRGYESEEDL